jgi:hypothetical protein
VVRSKDQVVPATKHPTLDHVVQRGPFQVAEHERVRLIPRFAIVESQAEEIAETCETPSCPPALPDPIVRNHVPEGQGGESVASVSIAVGDRVIRSVVQQIGIETRTRVPALPTF